MIRGKMKPYSIEIRTSGTDEYGQPLDSFTFLKTVDISITLITKVLSESDPRYIDSTHLGLTLDKTITDGMRLTLNNEKYMVKIVNNDGRMAQLTLEEVK